MNRRLLVLGVSLCFAVVLLFASDAANPLEDFHHSEAVTDEGAHQLSSLGHLVTVKYTDALIKIDQDVDIWPMTNPGEWMFELYVSSWKSSGVHSANDNDWVNFADLQDSAYFSGSSFTFQIRATEIDLNDDNDVFVYTVTVQFEYGMDLYYSGSVGDAISEHYFYYTIENLPPDPASITLSYIESPPGSQVVDFYAFTTDPEGDPFTYEWDLDYNGVDFIPDATSQSATSTYYNPGEYTAALRLTDSLGTSRIQTKIVRITERTVHGPIFIDEALDFETLGFAGEGTFGNPYVIENLQISDPSATLIHIQDTSAHFKIVNCFLDGQSSSWDGILLLNVRNGVITDNSIYDSENGIHLVGSTNIRMIRNSCYNNGKGIWLEQSDGNILRDNDCINGVLAGIALWSSNSNTLVDNACSSNGLSGIYLQHSTNNDVINNICNDNGYSGIYFFNSAANLIGGNTCNSNAIDGISLTGNSNRNFVDNNSCSNNMNSGIFVTDSSHNRLTLNTVDTSAGFTGYGFYLSHSDNITLSGNTVDILLEDEGPNPKYGYGFYLEYSDNNTVSGNEADIIIIVQNFGERGSDGYGHGLKLYYCDNNTLSDNTVHVLVDVDVGPFDLGDGYGYGLSLYDCDDSTVSDNNISVSTSVEGGGDEYGYGILMASCNRNTLFANTIDVDVEFEEDGYGIFLADSNDNLVFHNYFIENIVQAEDSGLGNFWYHPDLLEGNYWSDYFGLDDGSGTGKHAFADDGVGDTDIPWPGLGMDYYPMFWDSDEDGLSYAHELYHETDPENPDSDGDSLLDGWEVNNGLDPLSTDSDDDTLLDDYELEIGTDPTNWDTDFDQLSDADEIFNHFTNPLLWDTDKDGWGDWDEIHTISTDPLIFGPVYIDSNSDFVAMELPGSGTQNDPFIIDGLSIAYSTVNLIHIQDTTAYFVIRNCDLFSVGSTFGGIFLSNVENGKIEDNIIRNGLFGIELHLGFHVLILNNTISEVTNAFKLADSSYNRLENNTAENTISEIQTAIAYDLVRSSNNWLVNNSAKSFEIGYYIRRGSDNTLSINEAEECGTSFSLYLTRYNTLEGNGIINPGDYGFHISGSHFNNLVENYVTTTGFPTSIGYQLSVSDNNTLSKNSAAGQVIAFSIEESDYNLLSGNTIWSSYVTIAIGVPAYREYTAGFLLDYSNNNTLDDNTIYMNLHTTGIFGGGPAPTPGIATIHAKAISLTSSSENVLNGNSVAVIFETFGPTVYGYIYGFYLIDSDSNTISGNLFDVLYVGYSIEFYAYGVYLETCDSNLIFHNEFRGYPIGAYDHLSDFANYWYHPVLLEGNYWFDYLGVDLDGDGIGDTDVPWPDVGFDLYPLLMDADGDGLSDTAEVQIGTNPYLPDTDLDGISDGDEWAIYFSNPLLPDSDFDGWGDWDELFNINTDPLTFGPILIDDNSDFVTMGFPGTGEEGHPFIIEGYVFSYSGVVLIDIQGTDAYFIIRNCHLDGITQEADSIYLRNVENGVLENNVIINGFHGITLEASRNVILSYNILTVNFVGLQLALSTGNTLVGNDIGDTVAFGIEIAESSMNEIIGNFVYRGDAGIVVGDGSQNNTISDNTVFSNQWEGIGLHSTDNNTISGNDLFDNNDGIVLFEYSYRNNISTNEIHNNDWAGIVIGMDCDDNIIKGNVLYENNVGIRFADSSDDNTIEGNMIWSHFTGGILIVDSAENVFDSNTILSSGLYGIALIDSHANSFFDNSVSGCPYGLYLENSRHNTLLNNTVNEAINAFQLQYSSNNRFENNTAENTSEQLETSAGFRLIYSPYNKLLRNNVSRFNWGFSLKFSLNNTLSLNRAYQCEKAFRIVSSNYNLVDGNRAGNSAYGIYLSDAHNNTLSRNVIDNLDGIEIPVFTYGYGLYLSASDNNTLRGNDVSVGVSGPESLFATGAYLSESDDNTLSGNTVVVSIDVEEIVFNYGYGFNLSRCHRNTLSCNDVEFYITGHMFNYGHGFHLSKCEDNTLSGNTVDVWVWALIGGQSYGYGISLSISHSNTLLGNDVTVYAIAAGVGFDVDAYGYGISLESSDENTLSGNTIEVEAYINVFYFSSGTGYGYGIFLFDCENDVIDESFVDVDLRSSGEGTSYELGYGFYLSDCDSNIVAGNDIWPSMHGIYLTASSNNLIFHNNLVGNDIQAQDILSENGNYWYHPILLEGNYWSDYPGEDIGYGSGKHAIEGDGIGDTFIPWPGPNYDYYPFTDHIFAPPLVYQDLELGIAIAFNDVSESGSTTIEIPDSVPDPSAGFLLGDNFYSITTTVEFEGIIEIGISYDESEWTNENFVRIMHYNETTGLWEDITTWIDTENNIAYGVISSFSFFALMEIIDHDAPISSLSIDPVYYEVPIYYASSTSTISISAIDVFSGLHHIEYRIDGAEWTTFVEPFTIMADGQHTLEFRGIDNVGNIEITNLVTVLIDATRVTFTGSLTGVYSDLVYAEATLIELATQQPLAGREIIISIGTDSIVAQTGTNGIASGVILLTQPSGTVQCTTTFASDGEYLASSNSLDFTILKETAFTDYTGSTVVPETVGAITLRATVFDEVDGNWGDIALIAVTFRIYAAPIMDLDLPQYTFGPYMVDVTENKGIGVAITSIPNLPANSYVVYIVIESIHNDYYTGDWSQGVVLTVYEPTGDFVTGGGWLYDSDGKRANFGFNVKYKKNGLPGGQSIYVYREGDWEYLIKSNAWLGMAIEENHAFFEGKCTVQKFNIKTGELVWDEGNYQFRVDVWDNDEDGGVDVYQIRVLDKNGLVFYDAGFDPLGYLEGGNVIIHRDPKN